MLKGSSACIFPQYYYYAFLKKCLKIQKDWQLSNHLDADRSISYNRKLNTNSFPGDVRNPKDERNVRVG